MKNLKLISFLIILTSGLLFTQCTHDTVEGPQGVAGIDGKDGTDGKDGKDGADATASCVECHSDSHREPIESSFLESMHFENHMMYNGMTLAEYANQSMFRGSCVKCHVSEGYIDFIDSGRPANYMGPVYDVPEGISCTTCHDNHSTFDFETDGYDYALRSFEFVSLMTDPDYTIDYGNTSNNCIECHQPRTSPPTANEDGEFTVSSSHWGPHHGPQATLLEGIQGAEIAGSESYPGIGTATHRTGSSCVSCHMGESSDGTNGEHSFMPTETACTTCHTSTIPEEVGGLAEDMEALLVLLEEAHILHTDDYGAVHPVEGTYNITEAEAAWNYLLIMEDKSEGIHNPAYAKALVKNSIEILQ